MSRERLIQLIVAIIGAILGVMAERKIEFQPPIKQKEPSQPPPGPVVNPIDAIGQIHFGSHWCTATVLHPRRSDGQYDVLTANHCLVGVAQRGTLRLRSGREVVVVASRGDSKSDCFLLLTVGVTDPLPTARLAARTPDRRVRVWHAGFGRDKPGNIEYGEFIAGPTSDGQCEYYLSVSPGDSGGAIVRADTGEVLSPVCCTTDLGAPGRVWGASPESCWLLRR